MLFIVATLSFLLVHSLPGDPGRFVLGIYASAHQVHQIDQRLGYDRPLVAQYLTWLNHAVHGNLGTSIITHRSVSADLNARIPVTLSLAIGATILATVLGIVFGMLSAIRGGWVDRTVQGVAGLGLAIPNFWLAVLLVLVFSLSLKWLPAVGYVSYGQSIGEWARFLTLPVLAIGVGAITGIARQTRGAMRDVLSRDYVRTLAAAGVPRRSILFKHALRNASIPVVANIGFTFIGMIGGAIIIEPIFDLPGIGQWTLYVVGNHDLPEIEGIVVYTTAIVLLVNLLADVGAAWLNPKVRRR
jgi:peptide/nickel transport system permease protein